LSLPAAIQKEKGRGAVPENILGSSVVPFSERLWWFGLASTFELLLDVSFSPCINADGSGSAGLRDRM